VKWEKLGKIFDPKDHELAGDFVGFAQSPQALVCRDFVRIFFSVRERDGAKYLSHVQYVDFDKSLTRILGVSRHPVLGLGAPGCFDEHGIFPINVLRHGDKIYGYTTGWTRRVSVSADSGIGLVMSEDEGRTFQRLGDGPVLAASLHEPFLVADAFVQVYDGVFHMWYIFGTDWLRKEEGAAPDRVYKIAHATSLDGINWIKEGRLIIKDHLENECQALPTVLKIGDRYHMYFCYRSAFGFRENADAAYRLGYAYSDDLATWVRADDLAGIGVTEGDWDSGMMCYPHIFECDGNIYLLYNGNEFGRHGFGLAKLVKDSGEKD
jgi:hypothetical protein